MFFSLFKKPKQQTTAVVVHAELKDNSVVPSLFGATQQSPTNSPVQDQVTPSDGYIVSNALSTDSQLDEKQALDELLAYEKKIRTSIAPVQNANQAEDSTNLANERSEITRARQALRLRNPFRGV